MGSSPGSSSVPPVPAYFRWLEVQSIRCFGDEQRLELTNADRPAKWTVLLGDNGVGKTTLLQCLYAMAPEVHLQDDDIFINPRGLSLERVPAERNPRGKPAWVHAEVGFGSPLTNHDAPTIRDAELEIAGDFVEGGLGYVADLPWPALCCGYGASRRLGNGSLERRGSRGDGESLFETEVPLINAAEWLLQADYAARGGRARAVRRLDTIERALIDLLPDVDAIRVAGLDEDPPRPRVEVHTHYGWVGMRDLSLGYQTMIAWVVDLAARMFEVYSDRDNPLHEAAVVLVDEIDLHLHPRWQREITGYLDALFPNVQFIATAHSPLVVQGDGVTNVAVLRRKGDQVEILNDPESVRGWRVDQILTSDLFDLRSTRPAEIEELFDRQRELVLLDDPSDAQRAELREIDEQLTRLTPGETAKDREALSLIRDFAAKLRDTADGEP